MPLSEKAKNRFLAPFAISPILQKCALPGIVGVLLVGVGIWRKVGWLKVVGIVLAAPLLWVYFVVTCIFIPMLIFDKIRRGRTHTRGSDERVA